MRIFHALVGVTAILALGACASTGRNEAEFAGGPALGSDTDCFFARSVSDWRRLDNRNLIVFTGRRNPYHVQLSMRSMNMRSQESIAFSDRDGRICPYGGDSIIFGGSMPERISISSIRRLDEGSLEDVYRQFGIARPEIVETPEGSIQ